MTVSGTPDDASRTGDPAPSLGVIAITTVATLPLVVSAVAIQEGIAPWSTVLTVGVGIVGGGAVFAVLRRLRLLRRESWVLAVATPIALFGLALAVIVYAVVSATWAMPGLLLLVAGGAWGAHAEALREKHEIGPTVRLDA